jgi:hypothetical protein
VVWCSWLGGTSLGSFFSTTKASTSTTSATIGGIVRLRIATSVILRTKNIILSVLESVVETPVGVVGALLGLCLLGRLLAVQASGFNERKENEIDLSTQMLLSD